MAGLGIGGAAASGLESGFNLGLRANAQEDQRKQREFENTRQTAADARQAMFDQRTIARQDKQDANVEEDRALTGLNSQLEDARYKLGALHATYGDKPIPDAEAKPLYSAVGDISSKRQALISKRYQTVIDATTQKWRDFSSRAQAGDTGSDPSQLRGTDLREYIKATTGHDLTEFANGNVGKNINDATAGLGSGNMPMAINAAGELLSPQIRKGLGATAPDGSQIVDKSLYALVPAPQAGGMSSGQQNAVQANPVQGLSAALTAATGGAPPQGQMQQPQGLQPGSDAGLVLPVLQVTSRQPDGRLTTYHAPVTDGRGVGPDDKISGPIRTKDLMDRMGRLGVVDNWLRTPQMQQAVQEALQDNAPTTFDQAWAAVHGDPKVLNGKDVATTDPTSVKIAAIKKLAAEQYGGDFTAAAQAFMGHMGAVGSALANAGTVTPAAGGAPAAGGVQAAMKVSPADQAGRDTEQIKILQDERTSKWEPALAAAKASGDPAKVTKAQGDLDAINREIKKVQTTPASSTTIPSTITVKHGAAGLSPEQNQALFGPKGAVTEGRIDVNRINSKTAALFANAEIANPGQDLAAKSGNIQLARNATFRQKAMVAEALPEIMQNMVDAGKKVNFSNFEPIGQMQAWVEGKTNDPDLTAYMTQRNDALMTIAGVMRGVGMTDKAHQAEIEVAKPTMSPRALDAWYDAQMKALAPRLRINREVIRNAPGGGAGGETRTGTGLTPAAAPAPSAPSVGTVMKGYRFKGGDPSAQASWEKVQ